MPRPSDGVAYTFARQEGGGAGGAVAHFWELGSHEGLAKALTRAENLFLTPKQVGSTGVLLATTALMLLPSSGAAETSGFEHLCVTRRGHVLL